MKKLMLTIAISLMLLAVFLVVKERVVSAQEAQIGDRPALEKHVDQADINNNKMNPFKKTNAMTRKELLY